MAFFFVSVHELGRVERCGDTWVATDFFVFNFVPLFPIRSWLHVGAHPPRRIPLHWGSVAVGYARVAPLVLAVASLTLRHPVRWLAIAAWLGVAALAYFVLGKMSATEKAKRWLTAEFVGAPVALKHVRGELGPVKQSLEEQLGQRLAETGAQGYRGGRPSRELALQWDDAEALRLAFALARVDAVLATGAPEKRAAHELERATWERLTALKHNASELEMGRADRPSPPE